MSDLEQMREDVIRKIEAVFPKNPPAKNAKKWKLARDAHQYHSRYIEEKLSGKLWHEVVDADGLQYWFTDVDFLRMITEKAFFYYLPAILVTSLKHPRDLYYSSYFSTVLADSAEHMSISQLEVMIAFYEFHTLYFQKDQKMVRVLEDMALEWMFKLENKKNSQV